MNVAIDGKQAVQVTWQHLRIYDYDGHLVQSTPLADVIRQAGLNPVSSNPRNPNPPVTPGPYEPTIVYDEFINRWVMTLTGQSDILMVSATSDPAGAWGGVYTSCLEGGPCLNYDPAVHLGYDKNGVYVCAGHLGDDNPNTIPKVAYDCFAIATSDVTGISNGTAPAHINRQHNMPLDIMPAIDHTVSKRPADPALFATKTCGRTPVGACQNAVNYSFDWLVETFTWHGATGNYAEQTFKTDAGSKQNKWLYSKPCCGQIATVAQAGNDAIGLRVAESHRLANLVQFGTHLHAVMNSGPCTKDCGSQGEDVNNIMIWADINCSNPAACIVSQTAKISGASISPSFGTVGVDKAGNVGIVAVSTSAKTDLSLLLWARKKTDPPNTLMGPTMIASGTKPFTCLNTQNMATIGNAVGVVTALDPIDGSTLWTTQQWGNDAAPCVWTTRIVGYQIAGAQKALGNAPHVTASFDAVEGKPEMPYKDHPDMALAACTKCGKTGQVLVATGQDIAVYDTAGALLKKQSVREFIIGAGIDPDAWLTRPAQPALAAGKVNDPRATYDPFISRWIVVCSCSGDFLMVSAGQDATAQWKGVALTESAGDLTMFPGWDKNGVYVSEFHPKLNSQVIAIPSADVAWKAGGSISIAHAAVFSDRPYEMRPAIDTNPHKRRTDPEYLVARSGPPQNGANVAMDLLVDRIVWAGNKATVEGPTSIPTGYLYNTPIVVPQPSGIVLRGNESHRVFSVSAHAGHLYTVVASGPCSSDCGAQGADANNIFYWFDINVGRMALSGKAKVSDPALSFLFPTLAADRDGNTVIGATGGSSSQNPSIYLFTHLAKDPNSTIAGPFLVHSGTESYACDKGRARGGNVGWGTYSSTVQDGSDPTKLWTLQEYGGSATQCVWKTRVIGFQISRAKQHGT